MIVSMNELDSMARKAFRGAGYHWGEAEEAGKAATWLARRGHPVLAHLLRLLEEAQARLPAMRPLVVGQSIRAASGLLCPVLAGIAISDRAGEMQEGRKTYYDPLCSPLLVAPFLAAAAEASSLRFVFSDSSNAIEACGNQCTVNMPHGMADASFAVLQTFAAASPMKKAVPSSAGTISVSPGEWDLLSAFGARTYVPATAHSRLSGAGAGLQDGD